jgi:DNA/RNA endonuclease G (NUC1)
VHADEANARAFLNRISPPSAQESAGGIDPALELAHAPPPELAGAVESAVKKARSGEPLDAAEHFATEAIIIPDKRPAIRINNGDYTIDHPIWKHFDQPPLKNIIRPVLQSVGRIDIPNHPFYPFAGTGFVVGKDLLMTNRHVAELFCSGVGVGRLVFNSNYDVGLDFRREEPDEEAHLLAVRRVVMIHPYWDMALLQVDCLEEPHVPLQLSIEDPVALKGREVAVIGFPAFDPRNNTAVQNQVFESVYNVKRLQPGNLGGREMIGSFGHMVSALTHDSSTLGGNSGSVVFDPQSRRVVALHFAGVYLKANYCVPTAELGLDARIVDSGVNFVPRATSGAVSWSSYWRSVDAEPDKVESSRPDSLGPPPPTSRTAGGAVGSGEVTFTVPLEITIRIGEPGSRPTTASGSPALTVTADLIERARQPIHDDSDLASRTGYDPRFLGATVPLPLITDQKVAALQPGGSAILNYHHFSLAMHKTRRLALFTASNLDSSKTSRRPEPGRDYSRKGLTGLNEGDVEQWYTDPRIDLKHQLPDRFFTKDNGAFDKGHLVRRQDVAWGRTYQEIAFANGDTYYTTNCSPQVAGFNRSTAGQDNWGQLENYIMKQGATERLALFAGPVLSNDDPTFLGKDDAGPVRIQIPTRFWKVVVAAQAGALQCFAFLLEQDLSDVPLEFAVNVVWTKYMVSLAHLEKLLMLRFAPVMHASDQAGTAAGEAVRTHSGIARREPDRE